MFGKVSPVLDFCNVVKLLSFNAYLAQTRYLDCTTDQCSV